MELPGGTGRTQATAAPPASRTGHSSSLLSPGIPASCNNAFATYRGHAGSLARLEKAALRASESAEILAEPEAKLFPINTSGSTGIPLQVLRNSRDQAEVSALCARIFGVYGRRPSTVRSTSAPVAQLQEKDRSQGLSFDPPERQIALSCPAPPRCAAIRYARPRHEISLSWWYRAQLGGW